MINPKEKASELFFLNWFNNYDLLHKKSFGDTMDYIDKMIVQDKENEAYWIEVKKCVANFKV
jgi:hypothetical protein